MKKLSAIFFITLLAACSNSPEPEAEQLPSITTGAFPIAWLANQLAAGCATISDLTPAGGDVHDLELTPSQTRSVLDADLVITVSGFQPAFDDAAAGRAGGTLDLITTINPITGVHHGHDDEEHGHEADDDHNNDSKEAEILDPHFWLDPNRMTLAATVISGEISNLSDDCSDSVKNNFDRVQADLTKLDFEFEAQLAQCESQTLVVSHEAFGYLADAYELNQIAVAGLDPEGEPSAARLKEIVALAKRELVSAVFTESSANPEIAQTLANELTVGVLVLDPIELKPASLDYLAVMQANLTNLKLGLNCR